MGNTTELVQSATRRGARLCNADIGRFISADTIVPGAGNPQALNRYSYALNSPLRSSASSAAIPQHPSGPLIRA